MPFNNNDAFLYVLAVIIVIFVTIMSTVFMVRAYKEGQKRGLEKKKLNLPQVPVSFLSVLSL